MKILLKILELKKNTKLTNPKVENKQTKPIIILKHKGIAISLENTIWE